MREKIESVLINILIINVLDSIGLLIQGFDSEYMHA